MATPTPRAIRRRPSQRPTRTDASSPDDQVRRPAPAVPFPKEDVIVRIPLQDIIQRSVLYSTEVKVAGFDAAIAKTKVLEAEARFDPTAFVNF